MSEKVAIDQGRCQGHGRCAVIAPDVFDLDEHGLGIVLTDPVPDGQVGEARDAVLSCPESAITITGGS
ncbi:fdxD [Mycobacterium tuberculosis]|nr:fdxD [Mycobacterium tuberculosis]